MKVFCSPVFILCYKLNNVLSGSLPDLPSENTMIYQLLLLIPAGAGGRVDFIYQVQELAKRGLAPVATKEKSTKAD